MSATRRDIRESAFLLCYEKMMRSDSLEDIFKTAEESGDFTVNDEVKNTVRNIFEKQEELDGIISKYSDKRAVGRIPKVNLALLRLAIYQALYDEKSPVNVAISEAVALTQKYAYETDVSYVNGILGSFSKDLPKNTQEEKK